MAHLSGLDSHPSRADRIPPRLILVAERGLQPSLESYFDVLLRIAECIAGRDSIALLIRAAADPSSTDDWLRSLRQQCDHRVRWLRHGLFAPPEDLQDLEWHMPEQGLQADHRSFAARHPDSVSVHSLAAAESAATIKARWVQFGPIFAPGSKVAEGLGLDALRAFTSASPLPVIAVGGMTSERYRQVLDAGAYGIAVASFVLRAAKPRQAIEELLLRLS